ncbi:MAG: GAF domain-containing protein [Candidatus Schekmanbacteria bacterium]|nr:MAG: GAF domain-containing protein [Candidatus Schekmanbacteria bacterium]
MSVYSLGFLIGTFFTLASGFFVYWKNRKNIANLLWLLLCLATSLWQFGRFSISIAENSAQALYWCRIIYAGAIFIPVFSIHFILAFINKVHKRRYVLISVYIAGFIELVLSFTPYFISGVEKRAVIGFYEVPEKAYIIHFIVFISVAMLILYELVSEYLVTEMAIRKNQLKYLFIASVFGYLSGLTSFFPLVSDSVLPIASPFTALFVLIISYAIIKYKFLDISIVIKKSLAYTFIVLILIVPCFAIIVWMQKKIFGVVDLTFSLIALILFVLVGLIFPRVKVGTEKTLENLLFKKQLNHEETIHNLSEAMVNVLEKAPLLRTLVETLVKKLDIDYACIVLLNEERNEFKVESSYGLNGNSAERVYPKDDYFFDWLQKRSRVAVKEEIMDSFDVPRKDYLIEKMNELQAEVCVPILSRSKLVGSLCMGKKMTGEIYNENELKLFQTLSNQFAVYLENAKLYESLKESRNRMRRSDRLASLGQLAAGMAHEIRNPLVSIQTFLQLLPERINDKEFRTDFLKITTGEVERISRLLTALLDFSKPSKPKFAEENLSELLEDIVFLCENQIKKKNIQVEKRYDVNLKSVNVDKEQIKQVFLNIILNAIDATPENGKIKIATRNINVDNQTYVQVEISDTGIGIEKQDLENIFNPFFTKKEKGSGLGLSICHQIIDEHMGTISAESEVGKGSSFYINIPVNPVVLDRRKGDRT